MNKKGFIATSLLYSFFLLFCALILVFIGNMAQKSILLNKEIDQINEDLHSIKYLKNAKIGSYFRLNVCVSSSYFNQADTLDYIIFDNGTTNENNMASLISKNYSFKLNSLELINNILDISRIESGKEMVDSKDYKLENLLMEVNSIVSSKVSKDVLELKINVDPNIPTMYNGDSNKIYKILINVLLNAITHTKFGSVSLDVGGC